MPLLLAQSVLSTSSAFGARRVEKTFICTVPPQPQIVLMSHHLSKSRYTAGIQCHKLLWWRVHEPLAVELQPDKVLQDRFDQGTQVGTLARRTFPGGKLVDLPHHAVDERLKLTRK